MASKHKSSKGPGRARKPTTGKPARKSTNGGRHRERPSRAENGQRVAFQLNRVALRTIWAGVTRDKETIERLKAGGYYTAEFHALTQIEVPASVRRWVKQNLHHDGVVMDAADSEVKLAVRDAAAETEGPDEVFEAAPARLECKPEHGAKGKEHIHCHPLCGTP